MPEASLVDDVDTQTRRTAPGAYKRMGNIVPGRQLLVKFGGR